MSGFNCCFATISVSCGTKHLCKKGSNDPLLLPDIYLSSLPRQGRLTHCNIAAEGASNRLKNQNFGGPQAGGQGQQWGMMGQQQQYPAQGGM